MKTILIGYSIFMTAVVIFLLCKLADIKRENRERAKRHVLRALNKTEDD
jgi:hypothetical protein